eukprot:gene9883-10040_t
MWRWKPYGEVTLRFAQDANGAPIELMQDPLHYPHGTKWMAPGPIGQVHPLPDDKNIRLEMVRAAKNHAHIYRMYNFDWDPEPGSVEFILNQRIRRGAELQGRKFLRMAEGLEDSAGDDSEHDADADDDYDVDREVDQQAGNTSEANVAGEGGDEPVGWHHPADGVLQMWQLEGVSSCWGIRVAALQDQLREVQARLTAAQQANLRLKAAATAAQAAAVARVIGENQTAAAVHEAAVNACRRLLLQQSTHHAAGQAGHIPVAAMSEHPPATRPCSDSLLPLQQQQPLQHQSHVKRLRLM